MLSQNRAVSCNSCHHQSHGFAEPRALSSGLRQELTERNASHLANPGRPVRLLLGWPGQRPHHTGHHAARKPRRDGLPQPRRPGGPSEQLDYYPDQFEAAYGQPEPTIERIQDALSTFLRCLVSCRSKADDAFSEAMPDVWNPWGVLMGDIVTGLNDLELEGFELFHGKAQCANCHGGPHFNGWGLDFADIGLDADVEAGDFTPIDAGGGFFGGGWGPTAMKVPSLRNVALTAPYMHDGRFATLDEVIDHYSHGIQDVPTLDPRLRDWNHGVVTGGPDLIGHHFPGRNHAGGHPSGPVEFHRPRAARPQSLPEQSDGLRVCRRPPIQQPLHNPHETPLPRPARAGPHRRRFCPNQPHGSRRLHRHRPRRQRAHPERLPRRRQVCLHRLLRVLVPDLAAHAPYFTEVYNLYGCNGGDVIFMSMEYEGTWDQTHDFEVANAGDNPAPAISGAEGGGFAVHGDYSIQAYPTFILIDPEWNVVEQDIWPMSVEILDDVLQSYGLEQMTCVSSVEDAATVAS